MQNNNQIDDEEEEVIINKNIYRNKTYEEVSRIYRQIGSCNRMLDDNTKYCVCCNRCLGKYYYDNTHKNSQKHHMNRINLINYLCKHMSDTNDNRVVDILLYMVDNN